MKKFFVKMLLVLISAAVFIPTTATYAVEKIEQKEDLVVNYKPTELQKQLALRDVPKDQQKILINAIDIINHTDEPLASTNGPKGTGIKAAIKILKGLANNDFAQWMLSSMFGKQAVKGTVKNVNKIIKQIEHIVDTPYRAAKRANKLVYAELKKHMDAGLAQGIAHVVEYIIIVGDALLL
ncbi:hypothetical protein P8815_13845 [Bacillus altitudinis]|uniref:hypothetical protein n=1 Tax=Bacillus TaxID=1386 RepID=UPI000260A603|nr:MULTISPECIES: hypothetical protein [Bacillus]EIL85362.1 hypothetical protein BAME_13850 [Bacillus sp. M 2-6]MEC0472818.1 hypothetical protein [Bacillus altitudinis]NQW95325.1 hypothetical protein [Bacillus stratosphericus]